MRTSPIRAFTYVFDSPKWMPNLLWLTLAALTQNMVVGAIFLLGYGTELIRFQSGRSGVAAPDIDIDQLGDYINKGIVPILVYIAFALPLSLLVAFPPLIAIVAFGALAEAREPAIGGVMLVIAGACTVVYLVLAVTAVMCFIPVLIRSMVTQKFRDSFDFGWCWNFIKIMYLEVLASLLIYAVLSIAVSIVGLMVFCIGVLPASGLCSAAILHLFAQWYEIYLDLGGAPIPNQDDLVTAHVV